MSFGRISSYTLDAVRGADIKNVLLAYGVKLRRNLCCCPLHNDQHPSASIRHNRFHCFVCDLTLDSIGLIMALERCSFTEAVGKAAAIHGIRFSRLPICHKNTTTIAPRIARSSQYLLGYTSTNSRRDDTFRRITIKVEGQSHVRARQGYRATASKP